MLWAGVAVGFSRSFAVFHIVTALAAVAAMASFLLRPRRGALLVRVPAEAYLFAFYSSVLVETLLFQRISWP